MFILVEIEQSNTGHITKINAHGPFSQKDEAVRFYVGDNSVIAAHLESDLAIRINDCYVQIVQLDHPHSTTVQPLNG